MKEKLSNYYINFSKYPYLSFLYELSLKAYKSSSLKIYNNKLTPKIKTMMKSSSILFLLSYLYFSKSTTNYMECTSGNIKLNEKTEFLNDLENRASIIFYPANNPIEDRFKALELKKLNAYFISVLDGHGGFQLSQYANEKLYQYFDDFYETIKNNKSIWSKKSEDQIIIESLQKSFAQLEKEFYNIALDLYKKGEGRLATVGTCATASVITPNKIYTAQLGDSKAKLFRKNNEDYQIIKMTTTFNCEKEHQKIQLLNDFKNDKDIVVCKTPDQKICYVKGRLQPTRVFYFYFIYSL